MIATLSFALAAALAASEQAAPPVADTLIEWWEAKGAGGGRESEENRRCRLYNCGLPLPDLEDLPPADEPDRR